MTVLMKLSLDILSAIDHNTIFGIFDNDGKIIHVNDAFCKLSKYEQEDLRGKDHRFLYSDDQSNKTIKELRKTVRQGNIWKGDVKNKAKDGSFYWVHTTIVPFLNEDGKPYQFVAIRNDITDQKRAEESLIKLEKLSAIGELAAGVAHEIRNPLTTIKGFTEFLNAEEKEDKKKEYFKILLDEIERINYIVGEFMLLAKPQSITLKTKPLIPIITSVIKFLQSEMNLHNVLTTLDFGSQDIYIECDENQIKQVFLNIIKNAIEAMPTGGTLEIKLARKSDKIHIIFIDSGMGIPKEKLIKIGQPFFTTKESGNGLGMMVSFKIIQNHKGNIHIDSTEGVGTTFTIVLACSTL